MFEKEMLVFPTQKKEEEGNAYKFTRCPKRGDRVEKKCEWLASKIKVVVNCDETH